MMQADKPGLWYFHCHIVWHQLIGQGLVFVEGDQIGRAPLCAASLQPAVQL